MSRDTKNQLLIFLTLFIALYLDSYLFTAGFKTIKPTFVLLTLIYWNMALPDKVGILEALFFGLIMDLLNGSILGLHGLLFVLITYICQRFFYQFRVSPIWQQSVILFFLFFIFKMAFTFDFLDVSKGFNIADSLYLTNAFIFSLVSSIFWVPTFILLRAFRRKKIKI